MRKKRILIVDDEAGVTGLMKLNLERTGSYVVREENKGLRGAAAALEFKPDLIFLDVVMPDMVGADVAREIKNDDRTKHIPVVFLTAMASKDEIEARKGIVGGHPFLAKPVSIDEVIRCIEETVGK